MFWKINLNGNWGKKVGAEFQTPIWSRLDESKTDSCDERFRHKHKFGTKNRYFLEEIYISEKLRNRKKFALYSLLGQRRENIAIFKQTILSKRFIAFKMAFSCCFV